MTAIFFAGMPPGVGLWLKLGGVIGVGTLRAGACVVSTSKLVANYFIAAICLVTREGKSGGGSGLKWAIVSSRDAAIAGSGDDVASVGALREKNPLTEYFF